MYRCETCGNIGAEPVIAYERDGSLSSKCRCCGSERVDPGREKCDICGRTIFGKEYAYEAGELLICKACIAEVMIG